MEGDFTSDPKGCSLQAGMGLEKQDWEREEGGGGGAGTWQRTREHPKFQVALFTQPGGEGKW